MNADRKLDETRKAAYAGMGLSVKDAMSAHTEWADRVRTLAWGAGVEAWDLVCREYATGATGGAIVIATFTPAEGDREVTVVIDRADNPDEIRAKFIAANGKAVTATGRPYRHAASPESMAKLRATVNHSAVWFEGTGAIGPDPVPTMLFGKLIHFNPDGSVTWSKA